MGRNPIGQQWGVTTSWGAGPCGALVGDERPCARDKPGLPSSPPCLHNGAPCLRSWGTLPWERRISANSSKAGDQGSGPKDKRAHH